jgi:ABC-type transport system involved in cytochrome c biogenesis permease subunit
MASTPQSSLAPNKLPLHAQDVESSSELLKRVQTILRPFASLRVTVVLLMLAIFIVYAGTTAQVEMDIWQVVHKYFRIDFQSMPIEWKSPAAIFSQTYCWIELRLLFPAAFFPKLSQSIPAGVGFVFPKGWTIGLLMFINLGAAHLLRFRIQTRGTRLMFGLLGLLAGCLATLAVILTGSYQTANRPEIFIEHPSLRILWLLTQCTVASVILAVGCWYVFRKRAGIVLLHLGIGLLMFGELLVGLIAVETQMQIVEGQTVNFAMDTRELELALVDESGSKTDEVFAIPTKLLQAEDMVTDEDLPLEVELVKYMPNSVVRELDDTTENPATAGRGRSQVAIEVAQISGTDNSGRSNAPAMYVRFIDKKSNKELGVYLLTLTDWMNGLSETLKVDGREFTVQLRYKHEYKPYSLHLIDVEQDVYMGTSTARSYSSELRLVNREESVDREVRIWMNNPLRYGGATFYQSNYGMNRAGREYTGLQVVTNTGWRIPYMACMMVVVGMMVQFTVTLTRYLGRLFSGRLDPAANQQNGAGERSELGRPAPVEAIVLDQRPWWNWAVPLVIVIVCGAWIASKARLPSFEPTEIDYTAFGKLPVTYEGRVKPIDTLARSSLRKISDRQTYVDENDNRQPAVRWLLDVITDSEAAREHQVFRIHSLDVLDLLELKPRKGFRYSIEEIAPNIEDFEKQVRRARSMPAEQRDLFATKVLDLDRRLNEFLSLQESFRLPRLELATIQEDLQREANRRERYSEFPLPLAVPPETEEGEWRAYTFALFDALTQRMAAAQGIEVDEPNEATIALLGILSTYDENGKNASSFNQKVAEYQELLDRRELKGWSPRKGSLEVRFNHAAPLYYSMVLYLVAAIIGCIAWMAWTDTLRRASIWLCLAVWGVHTLALIARIYISGRPPVTTLYTSTLFVGWVGVLLGLLVEFFSRIGIANVVAAVAGFLALLIGYKMTTGVVSFQGDTFTVLVAVLDTNFWLATHVTCIVAGYGATILAGLLGIVFILQGVFTPALNPANEKLIGRMTYGVVCFAIFFSFFGTVLGGLWADDSWGRFWGWDPKENGALIIVLWNAVVLHALWGRMIGDRGLAVLSVFGIIVTAWSWFGVNELGVGLHSYGFTDGVRDALRYSVGVLLVMMVVGMLPRSMWISSIVHRRPEA